MAVRSEIPVGAVAKRGDMPFEDPQIEKLKKLGFCCDLLNANGYDVDRMRRNAPTSRLESYVAVTQPLSRERVEAIKKAKNAKKSTRVWCLSSTKLPNLLINSSISFKNNMKS